MSEPTTTTGAAWLGAFVATPLMFMGTDLLALGLALFGAVLSSAMLEELISTRKAAFAGVLLGALLGGYGSPTLAVYVAIKYPEISGLADGARLPVALVVGVLTPIIGPALLVRARRKAGGVQ